MSQEVDLSTFQELIDEAGIPNHGVDASSGRVDFAPSATKLQEARAKAILDALRAKGKPRRENKKTTRQAMRALADADKAKLFLELLVERELAEPGWAARRGVEIWPTT
jgi:hypothetical protein